MKVGTDSVLLGAWTPAGAPSRILDIGAGTGLLSLMMAQRFPSAQIWAIECNDEAAKECQANVALSPWPHIVVVTADIRQWETPEKYDLIISNPPFFSEKTLSPDRVRALSRSNEHLPFSDLLHCVARLLSPMGLFSVVIPYKKETYFVEIAHHIGLYPTRILHVQGTPESATKRSLLVFSFQKTTTPLIETLVIEKGRHQYTQEYQELTKNFYLKF